MRIGFDAKRAFFNRSGLGNYSRNTLRILLNYFPGNEYWLYVHSLKNRLILKNEDQFRIISPFFPGLPFYPSYWRSFGLSRRLKKDKLDLYHGLSNELPSGIQKSGVPGIVTIHDLIFIRHPGFYKFPDQLIYRWKFSASCQAAASVIAVSQQTQEDLIHYFQVPAEKIQVVYQGCDPVFHEKLRTDRIHEAKKKYNLPDEYILCVGTIEERKNQMAILEAMQRKNLDIPLVLVGKEKEYALKVRGYAVSNRMKNVYFLHEVSQEDLPGIYQGAQVFLYPSFFEGFGIPIVEALTSGIPVITSKGGCFSEAGGPGSVYIDPYKPDELAEALDHLLKSPSKCEALAEEGKRYAERFRDEKIAQQLMKCYQMITQ